MAVGGGNVWFEDSAVGYAEREIGDSCMNKRRQGREAREIPSHILCYAATLIVISLGGGVFMPRGGEMALPLARYLRREGCKLRLEGADLIDDLVWSELHDSPSREDQRPRSLE